MELMEGMEKSGKGMSVARPCRAGRPLAAGAI